MKKEREKQILELVRQQQLELLKHTFLSLLTVTYSVPREYMKLKSNPDYQEFYEELLRYFKTIDAKHPIIANKYEEMEKTPEGRQDMIDLYAEILEHLYRVDYQAPSDPWKILIHLQTMNRIDTLTHRQDLADRSLIFNLPQIEDKDRRPECQFLKAFEQTRPRILGALLDAVSMALKNIDKVKLPAPPRMADFALWITAAESALPWPPGSFMEAYLENRAEAVELSLEADCVAVAVRELMAEREEWTGKPSDLYEELEKLVPENTKRSKAWPKAANKLSNRLKRAATFLRAIGIHIDDGRSAKKRKITTTRQSGESTVTTVTTVINENYRTVADDDTKFSTVISGNVSSHDDDTKNHCDDSKIGIITNNYADLLINDGSDDNDDSLHILGGDVEEFAL